MYLKRLELQGFKSFQAKTLFEFGSGITSVVGPNGSGKSNVAESIRWVLGEQQSRSLRARRLEDVIFSGSSQKAAVGMAEVSMTLDNSEGWLPVDYSEVVVTRRAYRSGESEYLINKSKVRLRDVVDLFARAQVGQNSYAFMGQGLVEEVLVMRPEERRRLLEEAADVRVLRTRLDEARDRLMATRENLERVNLLVDEIAPRLKQLERQAERAAEHGRFSGELAATLRELYTQLWRDAQAALTGSQAALDQKQQELAVSQTEAKATEEGLAALTAAVEEREKELGDRRRRQRELSEHVQGLEQNLSFDVERLAHQDRRREETQSEVQSLRDERADLQASMTQAQERERTLQTEIVEAAALIEARREEMNSLEQEHGAMRRRVVEAEERVERARRGAREAEDALSRTADDESRSLSQNSRLVGRRQHLLEQLTVLGREYETCQQRLRTLESQIAGADQERHGLAAMVESSRSALQEREHEAMQLEAQLIQLRGREAMLRSLQNAAGGGDSGVRFLLGEAPDGEHQRDPAEGLLALVQDIVRVPPGLERAIEAALADSIQGLVFDNLRAALAAIEQLEDNQAGRATVYPLDSLRHSPPLNLLRERGVIGVAARLVRCDNRFRPLVDALLGRVIVVENVSLGQAVLKRGLGSVVTLDGVHLRPNGSIAGGLSRATVESFGRQRELEELPLEIAQLETSKREAESRLERERESLASASDELSRLEPRLHNLREERSRMHNALLENRGQLILLRGEARSLWAELHRDDDGTDWQARRQRLAAEKSRCETEAAQVSQSLEREREALAHLAQQRSAAIDAVSEAAAAHAGLQGEARSLTQQLELLRGSLARSDERLRAREQIIAAIEIETSELKQRTESAQTELAQAREELAGLQKEAEPAEGEFTHLEGRVRSMRDQLSAAQTRLLEAERAHLEAASAVKLRTDELEALRETMAAEGLRPEGSSVVAVEPHGWTEQSSGRLPPIRGAADVDVEELRSRVAQLRQQIRNLGPVNEQAQVDYGESKERYDFLTGQVEDLTGSEQTLLTAIEELESNIRERLKATFAVVEKEFRRYFESFFNGGQAQLSLTQPDDYANTGIDIIAQPPGKRVNTLAMLSGGERTLTSLALLMSLLEAHPSPICVLDEVDAALDETNVGRFVDALRALETKTQFIIITHNPRTIEAADSIYGVSMGSDNTSRILSLKLDAMNSN